MSCWFGMSPTPLTMPFFSVSESCLPKATPMRASFDRVAVDLRDAAADELAVRVVPRAVADAVARVDGAGTLRAQVGVPDDRRAAAGRGRQLLAVRVGAGEAAVVGAVALGDAGDEERHRLRRWAAPARAAAARDTRYEPA